MSFALTEGPKATNYSTPKPDVSANFILVNFARGERSIDARARGPRLVRTRGLRPQGYRPHASGGIWRLKFFKVLIRSPFLGVAEVQHQAVSH